jgi:hypothetical protein
MYIDRLRETAIKQERKLASKALRHTCATVQGLGRRRKVLVREDDPFFNTLAHYFFEPRREAAVRE